MSRIWVLLLLILTSIAGPLLKSVKTQETDIDSEALKLSENVIEKKSECLEVQHGEDKICCQPCPPGTKRATDCAAKPANENITVCVPCSEGVEYTDEKHYSSTCRRCSICDEGEGQEVEKNCTSTQNTKCKCKSNFFCNVSPCEHCNRCTTCEHGIIEACTPTSNTKCKEGSRSNLQWLFVLLLIPVIIAVVIYYRKKICPRNKKDGHRERVASTTEMVPMNLPDVDLSKYISMIAEQMEMNQVKEFTRKNGIEEAKIDEIELNYPNNTAEKKVQLLRCWYQRHGKKGAYDTLIKSLKKANLCVLAEKIQDTIQKDIASEHENANSNNENETQILV
ncbi:tumor necrosis factor receptor superfamily member 6 isoform X1 [Diceros bicornis minor]|uniref:tumor necrosis factor receptor superfamily member 6 isoform X1 n=1 Tax=Diceros bicornis minor TaxID=77932 RepID=UPI0026EB2933|nr:tumor necrosis factor receptor superfamily member 6 isoform X1 [Diceros bicornis minor]